MAKDDKKDEDPTLNGFFREIDEEVRQDKLTELWKQYGMTLVSAIVIVIVGFAGYEGWKAYDLSQREAQGVLYAQALEQARNNELDVAFNGFTQLEEQSSGGYQVLASLQKAALLARQGKEEEAVEAYFLIAQDGEVDTLYRELATVLGALNGLDSMDATTIIARLSPIAEGSSALRHSAQELLAYAHAKNGETDKANSLFSALSEDASAPPALRQRAGEFAQAFAS